MVLHKRQPLERIRFIRHMIEKKVGVAFENPQYSPLSKGQYRGRTSRLSRILESAVNRDHD